MVRYKYSDTDKNIEWHNNNKRKEYFYKIITSYSNMVLATPDELLTSADLEAFNFKNIMPLTLVDDVARSQHIVYDTREMDAVLIHISNSDRLAQALHYDIFATNEIKNHTAVDPTNWVRLKTSATIPRNSATSFYTSQPWAFIGLRLTKGVALGVAQGPASLYTRGLKL